MVNTKGVEPVQSGAGLPLAALNHISVVCRCLESSLRFYREVLGFVPIRRPGSFDFDGAWLFNYGIGVHLLQAEDPASMPPKKTEIDPKDNHISFQCESMEAVQRRLKELGIRYVQRRVEEGGIYVDQIFFHDPDGFMVEVCTCDNLPIVPLVPDGHAAILGLPQQQPAAPACKRPPAAALRQHQQAPAPPQQQQPLPVSVAVAVPTPVPAEQGVPAVKAAAGGGSCVGELELEASISGGAMRSCPAEQACAWV